jgi:hypothetical protein
MLLLGYTSPCSVALAAVRWAKGSQFGVEFIKMTAQDQRQLHYVIARHRSHRALTQEGHRHLNLEDRIGTSTPTRSSSERKEGNASHGNASGE